MLTMKNELSEYEIVTLSKECSKILQQKLFPKLKDSESFILYCSIGDSQTLMLLMPMNIYRRLGLGELKEKSMTLQLTNKLIEHH